jgi:hypothetical protein
MKNKSWIKREPLRCAHERQLYPSILRLGIHFMDVHYIRMAK